MGFGFDQTTAAAEEQAKKEEYLYGTSQTRQDIERQKAEAAGAKAGGSSGFLTGASAGASAGAAGGPMGIAIGALLGGVIGGIAGTNTQKKAAGEAFDEDTKRKQQEAKSNADARALDQRQRRDEAAVRSAELDFARPAGQTGYDSWTAARY